MSPIVGPVSDLTESECWDRLRDSLRKSIDLTKRLAVLPAKGKAYRELVEQLQLVEGAARQIGSFRDDTRWNWFGFEMASFHQRAGDIIRCKEPAVIFNRMAQMMEFFLDKADKLHTAKTGRRGPILPIVRPGPHRETRPVYVQRPSGLVVPGAA